MAIDGKTLRGSAGQASSPVHLLAAMDHATRAVLAQVDVDGKTNEITRFAPLLDELDLRNTVITADALHTQREHATWLVGVKHADYVLLVKDNQPTLRRQLERLPWSDILVADLTETAPTAAQRSAASRSPPCLAWASRMPPRRFASPAGSASCAIAPGEA